QHHVAAFRAEGGVDGVGQGVHANQHLLATGIAEFDFFSSHVLLNLGWNSGNARKAAGNQSSRTARISFSPITSRSSPSTLTVLLPEYGPNTTLSPTLTASGRTSPLSRTRPAPTATTSPRFGFSAAEPGRTMPPAVLVSSSLRRITTRSCRGRSFIVDLS